MNATLAPVVPPPGRIGFFCQSGALGIAILADAANRGLGLSTFVSAGNRADVSGNDLLQFWHGDDRTEVVLLYLESFGNPRKFARLARVLARTKPVIAVKSGRHAPRDARAGGRTRRALSEAAVATPVRAVRGDPDRHPDARPSMSPSCCPPSRCRPATGSRSSATPARWACWRSTPAWTPACRSPTARPLDLGVRRQPGRPGRGGPGGGGPPGRRRAGGGVRAAGGDPRRGACGGAAGGGQPRPPSRWSPPSWPSTDWSSTWPCRRRRQRRSRLGAVLPHPGAGGGRAGPRGAVRRLAGPPAGRCPTCPASTPSAAGALIAGCAARTIRARALTDAELDRAAGLLRHPDWCAYRAIGSAAEAVAAADEIGYPVALKSFDESLRHRIDQSGVRLGLINAEQVLAAYDDLSVDRRSVAARAGDGAAGPHRGVRPSSGSAPTRRSGRWSRSGSAGWPPNCSTTAPTGRCR